MSPEDRELLEAAAKAAGVPHKWNQFWGGFFVQKADGSWERECWNPLTDDAEALRLAVRLRITITFFTSFVRAELFPAGDFSHSYNADPLAATRRAIVRAAAAIGRSIA